MRQYRIKKLRGYDRKIKRPSFGKAIAKNFFKPNPFFKATIKHYKETTYGSSKEKVIDVNICNEWYGE
jgi:hypothetical protein